MKRLALSLITALAFACSRAEKPAAQPLAPTAGDSARGRQFVTQYACTACHAIPGTEGRQRMLGPSLAGLASRPAISNGAVQNTPANLRQFIQSPVSMNRQSAMPPIGLPDADAQDITAFLLTLK